MCAGTRCGWASRPPGACRCTGRRCTPRSRPPTPRRPATSTISVLSPGGSNGSPGRHPAHARGPAGRSAGTGRPTRRTRPGPGRPPAPAPGSRPPGRRRSRRSRRRHRQAGRSRPRRRRAALHGRTRTGPRDPDRALRPGTPLATAVTLAVRDGALPACRADSCHGSLPGGYLGRQRVVYVIADRNRGSLGLSAVVGAFCSDSPPAGGVLGLTPVRPVLSWEPPCCTDRGGHVERGTAARQTDRRTWSRCA